MAKHSLVGIWVPCINRVASERPSARVVFLSDGKCLVEQGDYPAVYAVSHFDWRLTYPTILEFGNERVEEIASGGRGTIWVDDEADPTLVEYNFAIHEYPEGIVLEADILTHLGSGTFLRTNADVDENYGPNWMRG